MADTIKIRRSAANSTYPALAAGELAYSDVLPGQLGVGKVGGGNDTIGPMVTSQAGAPSSTPSKIGDVNVNTSNDDIYVAKGTASSADWSQVNGAGTGDLLAANNLSDVGNALTATQNLSVEVGVDVQAYSAVLDATTASFLVADESKLDGIAAGATVNSTDATLLARANHTGTQAMATISDAGALATLNTVSGTEIDNLAVTEGKLSTAVQNKLNNEPLSNNLAASTAPGATNDINDTGASDGVGYVVGSIWVDTTADEAYRCVDNTDGAAVWINTTLETSELGALAVLNTVDTAQIENSAVQYAKLQNVSATDTLLGRDTAGAGVVEEISMTALLTMLGGAPTNDAFVKVNGTGTGLVWSNTIDGGTF